jgi:hypothetical protein
VNLIIVEIKTMGFALLSPSCGLHGLMLPDCRLSTRTEYAT